MFLINLISCLVLWCFSLLADATCSTDDPWSVRLGNAYITLNNAFTADITGTSDDGKYSINIVRSKGIVTQGNRATTVIINLEIPRTQDYAVYNILGVDSVGLLTGRAYCDSTGKLTAVWLDDTSNPVGIQKTTTKGTCNITQASHNDLYQVPDECLTMDSSIKYPTIQGAQISLQDGQPGSVTVNQNDYTLLPFNVIDCKNCSQNGWVEIHSLLANTKSTSDVCMAIIYLYTQSAPVTLSWLNCFEQLQPNATLPATYDIQSFNTNSTGKVSLTAYNASAPATSATTSGSAPSGSADPQSSGQSNGLSTGAKVGIGLGIALAILLIVAVVCILFWRRRRTTNHSSQAPMYLATNMVKVSSTRAGENTPSELHQEYGYASPVEVPNSQKNAELAGASKHQAAELPS